MNNIMPKTSEVKSLCLGLNSDEFKCRCNYDFCTATIIDDKLLEAYKNFRKLVNVPLHINSGYRCPAHNADEGGSIKSQHMIGKAIDISLKSLDHLSKEEIEHAARVSNFTVVLFYKTAVHLDVR
jgi:uncharacterized protein YcbK (DUF882 family)